MTRSERLGSRASRWRVPAALGVAVAVTLLWAPASAVEAGPAGVLCSDDDVGQVTEDEVVGTDPQIRHVRVKSHDCTELDGWLILPEEAETEPVPAVLWSGPYFGQCNFYPFPSALPQCDYPTGDNPELRNNDRVAKAVPIDFLLEHGYAVPVFNVRGTGNSGGCFTWFGEDEQLDQAFLVEWLAEQPWSNGNIGMMGLSYHGTTPWGAAVHNPPSLKTIVVAGTITDAYTFSHTPQGATLTIVGAGVFPANFAARVTLTPPIEGDAQHATVDHLPVVPERVCPDVARYLGEDTKGMVTDLRDQAFWDERRLIDRFPDVETAVFVTHGLQDLWLSGHQSQENEVWHALEKAPKRMLLGQWGHEFPNFNSFNAAWALEDWNERLLEWLDHWLQDDEGERAGGRAGPGKPEHAGKPDGRGRPDDVGRPEHAGKPRAPEGPGSAAPGEGVVEYQDSTGAWHTASAWPPPDPLSDEVLYLGGNRALTPAPGSAEDSRTFWARSQALVLGQTHLLVCEGSGVRYESAPVAEPTTIAGNPFAHLRLTSDRPGGLVAVHLFDLAPSFRCQDGTPQGGVQRLATGAADLRFHQGNFIGQNFPLGTPTPVRVDITNLAHVLEPGHRLGVVVSAGDNLERTAQPWYPNITVHADGDLEASHVVIPSLGAGFGGDSPVLDYPPRPFLPR